MLSNMIKNDFYTIFRNKRDKIMKRILKGLLFASLLSVGAGSIVPITTAKADNYGIQAIFSSVATIKDTGASLYDVNGHSLGRYLPRGSTWKTNLENTLASGSYYGVGIGEYVKGSDISLSSYDGITGPSQARIDDQYDGLVVTDPRGAAVYDVQGNPIGITLPSNSNWKVDYQVNTVKGTFYRVGVGEYVSGNAIRLYQNSLIIPKDEIITTTGGSPKSIYNYKGQIIPGRALGPNTSWYTDQFTDISHLGFYRVATDEYVSGMDVQ